MTLLDRPTLVDRPELVNRDKQEDEEDKQHQQDMEVEALGEGGGPIIHSIEFAPGDYEIVAGANMAAVLSTGQDSGQAFEQSFRNAAIQLYELEQAGEDISDIVRFSVEKGVAETGLTESELEVLTRPDELPDEEQVEEEDAETEEDSEDADETVEDPDIEDVEEDLEEITEETEDEG